MTIFNWIKTNVSNAISSGIREGVATGLADVTGGEVEAVDAEFQRIEAKPAAVSAVKKTKRAK